MTAVSEVFPIIPVPDDAAQAVEAMGTKPKFWFRDPSRNLCLYKEARPGTGEDWAEKVAAELAELLGLPHANYELATWRHTRGTISPLFVPKVGRLIHGNELLLSLMPGYPTSKSRSRNFYRVSQHTLDLVLRLVSAHKLRLPIGWTPLGGVRTPTGVFVGYLLLDAWIANQDRHHENWGWVVTVIELGLGATTHLAPTYDHASSLGRNESDEARTRRLTTKDRGWTVEAYVEKAKSALYAKAEDKKPLTTFEAFRQAAERHPVAGQAWLDRLDSVSPTDSLSLLQRVPRDRISKPAIQFAQRMLELNRDRLLNLREQLS